MFDPSDEAADSTTIRGIIHFRYDNLDSVLEQDVFAGNDVLLSNVSDAGVEVRRAAIRSSAPRSFTRMTTASDCRIRSSTSSVSRMAASGSSYRDSFVQFDADDNVTYSTDARSAVTHFVFDGAGRLTSDAIRVLPMERAARDRSRNTPTTRMEI